MNSISRAVDQDTLELIATMDGVDLVMLAKLVGNLVIYLDADVWMSKTVASYFLLGVDIRRSVSKTVLLTNSDLFH